MPKATKTKPYELLGKSKSGYHRMKRENPRLVAKLLREATIAAEAKAAPTSVNIPTALKPASAPPPKTTIGRPKSPFAGRWVALDASNDPRPKVAQIEVDQQIRAAVRAEVKCAMLGQIRLTLSSYLNDRSDSGAVTLTLTEQATFALLDAVEAEYGKLLMARDAPK